MPRKKASTRSKSSSIKKKLPSKEQILNSEVTYFRGLSVLLIVMLIIIFFTFSALFGAMYMETKYMRLQLEEIYKQLSLEIDQVSSSVNDKVQLPTTVEDEDDVVYNTDEWLSFEKYGFSVSFPETWTFLDLPFVHQVHFFSDGVVRDDLGDTNGDFYINIVESDNYREEYSGEVMLVGIEAGRLYKLVNENILVVPTATGYLELHFSKKIDAKLMMGLVDNFVVLPQ